MEHVVGVEGGRASRAAADPAEESPCVSLAQKTLKTWRLSPNVEGTEVISVHRSSRVLGLSLRFIWAKKQTL